jgi:hypothetical protein
MKNNLILGIKSKSMRLVIEKHVTIRLKCGSGCGADADGYGDKIPTSFPGLFPFVILMIFFASFLRFCVFDLVLFFCNGCNVVLTSYTTISIKECH